MSSPDIHVTAELHDGHDHASRDGPMHASVSPAQPATHSTQRLRLVFDLDGTLFDSDGCDYEDADSVREKTKPHPTAIALVQQAYRDGHGIAYLTGRCEHLRPLTQLQLDHADLPPGELVMQRAWTGYDSMAIYKSGALRRMRAHLYVGDHEADHQAAQHAEVPFWHADDWRRGITPPTLQNATQNPGGGA